MLDPVLSPQISQTAGLVRMRRFTIVHVAVCPYTCGTWTVGRRRGGAGLAWTSRGWSVLRNVSSHEMSGPVFRRYCRVTGGTLAREDEALLNQYQTSVCRQSLYSSKGLTEVAPK